MLVWWFKIDTVPPDEVQIHRPVLAYEGTSNGQNCVGRIRERSIDKRSARAIFGGMNVCSGSMRQYHEEARNRRRPLAAARGQGTASAMPRRTTRLPMSQAP